MTALLLIDLPLDPEAPVSWLLWDSVGGSVVSEGVLNNAKELSTLAETAEGVPCYALIPGDAVSAHGVVLPKGGRVGLSALPFQLEDKLCSDLDSVHITTGVIKANHVTDVLVLSREIATYCKDVLHRSGLRIKALLPDYAVLPDDTVVVGAHQVAANFHAKSAGLSTTNFQVWQQLVSDGEQADQAVQWYFSDDYSGDLTELAAETTERCGSRLHAFARGFKPWPMSLLSGEFALKDESSEAISRLRWPVILLVALLFVHWLGLAIQTRTMNLEADALDKGMVEIYKDVFPGARVVNARSQMRSQLNALESAGATGAMMPWLDKVAAASRGRSGVSLSQLNYENDPPVMKLLVKAASYELVDQWLAALKAQGLDVDRGAFGQDGGGIAGQISIRGAAQ
ncbi:Type II secretion system protein L [Zhongshania aliphaticivorans]|uniref:Type II secretion system protein L n=1 Tax=Zhongshania aliphaticivorans TaxID=1470434 RepID=A0A5S9NC89_9GAMM|nr:type II secretion system protein GspL [Zhongshania aliphaticivorans]CAA0087241.1 Type II secretion system protein L [Zhongshania aliphaticivorans]CAA0114372.1 Type II secretion system protein L [Zhongshania aliphaticivorans]